MKLRRKLLTAASVALVLAGALLWQFGPFQAVFAIANLSAPDKLATLAQRGANSRLNKIVYWLDRADCRGLGPDAVCTLAQTLNGTPRRQGVLVRESLLRNLKIARELGLLTRENQGRLRRGHAAEVTRGPCAGEPVEIDHVVPFSLAPEAGNELANLEMLPRTLNRQKLNRVGDRQLALGRRLHAAGLLTRESLARVEAQAR